MKFDFFEIVKVSSSPAERYVEVAGQEGVVIGKAEELGTVVYAVSMSDGLSWQILESELEATGKYSSREEIYG